jgi:SAM-dependent methyltransferase
MTPEPDRARSFGAVAALYDRVRPTYPAAAIDAALPASAARVIDVGAGTGKLTAALLSRGLDVIAVEPDREMRRVLGDRLPRADLREGTAEHLPLEDDSVDAVVFGQSWHWADPSVAANEAARVLRPRGTLGLLWNMDDDSVDWVAELRRITGTIASIAAFEPPVDLPRFCAGHRVDVPSGHRLARADLPDLVSTWSSVSTLPERERGDVMDQVAQLLRDRPEIRDLDPVELPQITVALTYHLGGDAPT